MNFTALCACLLTWALACSAEYTYQIYDGATDKCLDNGNGNSGGPVLMWNCKTFPWNARKFGQHWVLELAFPGYYYVIDKTTGRCLDNGRGWKGKNAELWDCVPHDDAIRYGQLWNIICKEVDGIKYYMLKDFASQLCLDNGLGESGKPLVMWTCYEDDYKARQSGQLWQFWANYEADNIGTCAEPEPDAEVQSYTASVADVETK